MSLSALALLPDEICASSAGERRWRWRNVRPPVTRPPSDRNKVSVTGCNTLGNGNPTDRKLRISLPFSFRQASQSASHLISLNDFGSRVSFSFLQTQLLEQERLAHISTRTTFSFFSLLSLIAILPISFINQYLFFCRVDSYRGYFFDCFFFLFPNFSFWRFFLLCLQSDEHAVTMQ